MSKVAEFRDLERQIADQLAKLDELKADKAFQAEAEFEDKLRKLMGEYSMSLRNIITILDPQSTNHGAAPAKVDGRKGPRAPRALKRYHNPHTGEVVETKGGNHKTLNAWKAEHGAAAVASWVQE